MQYEEYRAWMIRHNYSTASVNVRAATVKMIEREMATLGSVYDTLDAAYDTDQFSQLRQGFDALRADAKAGGERYRKLFPDTAKPFSRISEAKSLLGHYAKFLSGAVPNLAADLDPTESYWFVGSSFGGTNDQTDRFLAEGIWEVDTPKKSETEAVGSMRVGDRIAIKASFVQRLNLPFNNRGQNVSVMRIKARGVITASSDNGACVSVDWDADYEPRDWYFYTFRPTIWQVHPGHELADKLIAFAFFDEPQDVDWFRNHGTWAKQHGDTAAIAAQRFWIEKTIVAGRADREGGDHALGCALWSPQKSKDGKNIYANMLQVAPGDVVFHLTDNESISDVSIASEAANTDFICLEGSDWTGQAGFRIGLTDHEKLDPPLPRDAFLDTEPFATELRELAESGAKGLFYNSRRGLNQGAYLTEATPTLLSILSRAYAAFAGKSLPYVAADASGEVDTTLPTYTLDDALESLFIDRAAAAEIMLLWSAKKNIILQGPPGVGKSYAAQKLAFALIGAEDRIASSARHRWRTKPTSGGTTE